MKKIDGWVTTPQGFLAAGVKAGIKASGNHDVAVIYSTVPAATGAVFTQNKMCAAPVLVSRKVAAKSYAQAIVVNSGCANACTGEQGLKDAEAMQAQTAELLGVENDAVYVCSTGVIGHFMPMDKLAKGIADAVDAMDETGGESCAMAIQTTDTFIKHAAYEFELGGKTVKIAGIAKGAGMIHPNMATMLVFLTTDCAISAKMLQQALSGDVSETFNMVSVDGDTSTNDMVTLLANGMAGNAEITAPGADFDAFMQALNTVTVYLCRRIAGDGEGATKLLECKVTGAATHEIAKTVAKSVICSSLTKAAMFGADANWGRVLCAIGYSGADVDVTKIDVAFRSPAGTVAVCQNGAGIPFSEEQAKSILSESEIEILVELNAGSAASTAWGCDLTYDYVKINGDYRT